MVFFDRWNKWIAVSWALPLFVFFVVRSLGACAVIAVTIGHACLTGWLLASLATRSPLSLLSRCPRYLGALACTECTLLHATLPTRPLPMYHLSTCATVRNCLSPLPLPSLLPLLLITSLLPSVSSRWTSLVHLDRSFCSRFFGYLLDSLYFSFRFSSRIYWILLHGCFLCASLFCLIIILSTMFTFHACVYLTLWVLILEFFCILKFYLISRKNSIVE